MRLGFRSELSSMPADLPDWFDYNLKQELFAKRNRRRGPLSFVDQPLCYVQELVSRGPAWRHVTPYRWSELEAYIEQDCRTIGNSIFRPDVIIGIKSGGAFIANYVARCLDVRQVGYVKVDRYAPVLGSHCLGYVMKYYSSAKLTEGTELDLCGQNVLLVDDQSATGKSLMIARRWIADRGAKAVRTYCIFSQGAIPDFGGREGLMRICPWGDDP